MQAEQQADSDAWAEQEARLLKNHPHLGAGTLASLRDGFMEKRQQQRRESRIEWHNRIVAYLALLVALAALALDYFKA